MYKKLFLYSLFASAIFAFDIEPVDDTPSTVIAKQIQQDVLQKHYGKNFLKFAKDGKPIYKAEIKIIKSSSIICTAKNIIIKSKNKVVVPTINIIKSN